MKHGIFSASEWLYPDSDISLGKSGGISLTAAKKGFAAFQLLIEPPAASDAITVSVSSDSSFSTAVSVEAFRELDVFVERNTGEHGFTADWETAKAYATRPAPFRVFDALEPFTSAGVKAKGGVEALYFSLNVRSDAPAGSKRCVIQVSAGGETVSVEVSLDIVNASVPDETLYITNWFSLSNMASSHHLEPWSDAHYEMIRKYAALMRRARQNVFWITWDTVKAERKNGKWKFDFSRAERVIEMFLDMGFELIEGSPIYGRDNWGSKEFKISTPEGRFTALSEEGYDYAAALLVAWRDFLLDHDWYELLIQHVGDEPHGSCADEYRILSGIIRKFLPGVTLIDAVETHELCGAVDIWVPKNDYYSRNMEAMEKLRSQGDEMWIYTCCIPGGHYCNRLLDMPLLRTRMLHWGNYRYSIPGYLHWGLNHWRGDPYEDTTPLNGPTNRLPAGDTNIVYPIGQEVIPSMRAEQMRAGASDYELLNLLAESNPDKANEICASAFRSFDDCDNSPEAFDALHDSLLRALE